MVYEILSNSSKFLNTQDNPFDKEYPLSSGFNIVFHIGEYQFKYTFDFLIEKWKPVLGFDFNSQPETIREYYTKNFKRSKEEGNEMSSDLMAIEFPKTCYHFEKRVKCCEHLARLKEYKSLRFLLFKIKMKWRWFIWKLYHLTNE